MKDRPSDQQLTEWLYAAEYDFSNEDFSLPMPGVDYPDTFPKYYEDDYRPTLAALISELLELRASRSILLADDLDQLRELVADGAVFVDANGTAVPQGRGSRMEVHGR